MSNNRSARRFESVAGAVAGAAGVLLVLVVNPPTAWVSVGAAISALCAVLAGTQMSRARSPRWLALVTFVFVVGLFLMWAELYPAAGMIYIFALGSFAALAMGFRAVAPREDSGRD